MSYKIEVNGSTVQRNIDTEAQAIAQATRKATSHNIVKVILVKERNRNQLIARWQNGIRTK